MRNAILFLGILAYGCGQAQSERGAAGSGQVVYDSIPHMKRVVHAPGTWAHFLQHLPLVKGPILDYRGREVPDQEKGVALVNFDVGKRDLQQCADAIMRLRAEYLFGQGRHNEIGFHFTDGSLYKWYDYCNGLRPVPRGQSIRLVSGKPADRTHESLRAYLDLVYTYAGTISLQKELKTAPRFEVGTVVIRGGSPGHCFIIVDEATDAKGRRLFKLAEGYTPAQSIYILSNPFDERLSPWYELKPGPIETPSYEFTTYKLGTFE